MTDPPPNDRDSKDEEALRSLVKRSAAVSDQPQDTSLLRGVQRKIRLRSRGKFYRDGWSTGDWKATYVVLALVMLFVLAIAYLGLGPSGFTTP